MSPGPATDSAPRPRPQRSDGEQSRERLLQAALTLFAQQGFAKTSTREIAEAAGANLAAISYYFGDKAGLYRAVFLEPVGDPAEEIARLTDPALTLAQALHGFFAGFAEPLGQGDLVRQCMKLHMREMLEPTGLWEHEIEQVIRPSHEAMLGVLCRELGLAAPDEDVHRLAISLAALGVHLHVGYDVTEAIAPALHATPAAIDIWLQRLVMYGLAMVEAERSRRTHPAAPAAAEPR
jgi:AcrR family transcriptional regulator